MAKSKLYNKKRRLSHLYKIVDKQARTIVFKPNKAQDVFNNYKAFLKKEHGRVRLMILKARQLGITTDEIIDNLDTVLFYKNQTIVLTAHEQKKMEEIFRKAKFAYDNLPGKIILNDGGTWIKPKPSYDNRNELFFPALNSTLRVALDSRSGTLTKAHITELAFRRDAEEMMLGTLPSAEQADITIESTANGIGNFFERMWKQNRGKKDTEFKCLFFPWYMDENYKMELEHGEVLEYPDELKHIKDLPTDDEHRKWYIYQYIHLYKGSIFQEYPSNPREAFMFTGRPFFNLGIISQLLTLKFDKDLLYPDLRWYKDPEANCLYGVDTAEGGADGDYSVITVRNRNLELICQFRAKFEPDELCEVIDYLRNTGCHGVIGIEKNNTGLTTLTKAKEYHWHQYLYKTEIYDNKSKKTTKKIGFTTTTKTRPLILNEFEALVRGGELTEFDEREKDEIYTFIYDDKKKPVAEVGNHDDCIMSDAICLHMRHEQQYIKINDAVDIIDEDNR